MDPLTYISTRKLHALSSRVSCSLPDSMRALPLSLQLQKKDYETFNRVWLREDQDHANDL
jgi:hypothetical protein